MGSAGDAGLVPDPAAGPAIGCGSVPGLRRPGSTGLGIRCAGGAAARCYRFVRATHISISFSCGLEGTYARTKIMSLFPEDRAREVALKSSQVVIDPTPWMGRDRTGPLLERIRTAMDEGRLVAFRYSDRKGLKMSIKSSCSYTGIFTYIS